MPNGRPAAELRRFAARSANYIERRARRVHRRLLVPAAVRDPRDYIDPEAEEAEVLVYFPEVPRRLYQLAQWLPVMERLSEERPTACVVRSRGAYAALVATTSLPVALLPRYSDLMAFYAGGRHKVVVYVNHARLNFQSLTLRTALHVHVNHGESDKRSSFSNQAKAYDRVFVAGEIAAQRYRDHVLEFEERRLVQVGRPPLDFVPDPVVPPAPVPTVMYAPTWEGESADNDWSSARHLGVPIVQQLLGLGSVRVFYKPHPRISSSTDPGIAAAHQQILGLLADTPVESGHLSLVGINPLAAFRHTDALVTDVSAVGLDYLFLRPECPIVLTDTRNDPETLSLATPLAAGSDVVHADNVSGLAAQLADRLATDARGPDRHAVRAAYFGDLAPGGESTRRFLAEIQRLCATRDELLRDHPLAAPAPSPEEPELLEDELPRDLLLAASASPPEEPELLEEELLPDQPLAASAPPSEEPELLEDEHLPDYPFAAPAPPPEEPELLEDEQHDGRDHRQHDGHEDRNEIADPIDPDELMTSAARDLGAQRAAG